MIWRILSLVIVFVLLVTGINTYLSPDDLYYCKNIENSGNCRKADAIVVISGGDTNARTDEAIKLFKAGWAKYIVFSGAAADKEGISNAKAMQLRALDSGVPEDRTIIEEKSETTKQNASEVKSQLANLKLHDIILVTSGYHMRRASLEFGKELGSDFLIRRHPIASDNQWNSTWWLTPRGWWMALGEILKIAIFYVGGTR